MTAIILHRTDSAKAGSTGSTCSYSPQIRKVLFLTYSRNPRHQRGIAMKTLQLAA
jgi:hypothetical protein